MTNGRSKGKRGERECARLFEQWWGQVEPGCNFKSTPLSGGWASPDVRSHFKTAGDLVTTAELFPFTIEVKLREAWSPEAFADGNRSPVWRWWKQAVTAAATEQRIPLLIFRKNRQPWYIILPEKDYLRVTIASPAIAWNKFSKGVNPDPWPICFLAQDVFAEHATEVAARLKK